jgi:hypothetical protein
MNFNEWKQSQKFTKVPDKPSQEHILQDKVKHISQSPDDKLLFKPMTWTSYEKVDLMVIQKLVTQL